MDFTAELKRRKEFADKVVTEWLPQKGDYPGKLIDAFNYAVLAGGKRIRPVLMRYVFNAYGGKGDAIKPFMAAMEYIHTASLIHDDLPAIDNDNLRRGKPTAHAVYGEAVGLLCGDALLNYAYEVLIKGVQKCSVKENGLKAAAIISKKSGAFGMLGGQGIDVEFEKTGRTFDTIEKLNYMYERKTAALIEASLMAGAALAGASDEQIAVLESCGSNLGMAFQIRDDILDVESTQEELGKPIRSDEKNQKVTYVTLIGTENAQKKVAELTADARDKFGRLDCDTTFLESMASYLENRKN